MRLRATRLSATGGHTRKRGIDIAALFAGYPGRVGCYYGTKSGPSYSDILARNREALGPELVTTPTPRVLNLVAYTADQMSAGALTPGAVYLTVFRISSFTSGSIRSLFFGGTSATGSFGASTGFVFSLVTANAGNNSTWLQAGPSGFVGTVEAVSVRQITDWSKLVLFDDANGTVPVFSVFQSSRGRGLLLDASQGLVRGAELITNGGFSTDTNWIKGSGWAISGGVASRTSGVGSSLEAAASPLTTGKWYEVQFDRIDTTASAINIVLGGAYVSVPAGSGRKRVIGQATSSAFSVQGGGEYTIDNVSVRELPGNHMVQPTAAARGELSARVNLLESTEDVRAAYWNKNRSSPTSESRVEATETSSNGYQINRGSLAIPPYAAVVASVRLEKGNRDWALIVVWDGSANGARQWVNTATGELGVSHAFGTGFSKLDATAVLTGAYVDVSFKVQATGAVVSYIVHPSVSADGLFACTAGDYGYMTRMGLRLAADAIPSIPSYQRVTSATDYDDVGFPVYWRGQTDDWAKTHINPAGATKALVMWAGQKLSPAVQIFLESSAISVTVPGTVAVVAGTGTTDSVLMRSTGSASSSAQAEVMYIGSRRVVRGRGDIQADVCDLLVNGALAAANSADQGTGSYTEQDVYFGARGGTDYFANIREYAPPLILFQPTADTGLSASQITALDKAFAKAAGVTL